MKFYNRLIGYLRTHYISRYWVMLADVLVSTFATLAVFGGVNVFLGHSFPFHSYCELAIFSTVSSWCCFFLFRTHRGVLRHITLQEIWKGSFAILLKGILIFCAILLFRFDENHSLTIADVLVFVILDVIFSIFLFNIERIAVHSLYVLVMTKNGFNAKNFVQNVLIFGDDDNAVATYTFLEKSCSAHFRCVGFISVHKEHFNNMLCGQKIYFLTNEQVFAKLIALKKISAVVFSSSMDARDEEDGLIAICSKMNVRTLIRPALNSLKEVGSPNIVRDIKIEDLLGREEVNIDFVRIKEFLTDKTVVVTGGAGSIGGELSRLLITMPIRKLILIDIAETPMNDKMLELRSREPKVEKKFMIADVRKYERIDQLFTKYRPDIVFHAAAYKHVPMMESNPAEAVFANVLGTKNLVDVSIKHNIEKFVMVSTDKAVNPANVMGCSKRIAEIYVQSIGEAIESGKRMGRTKFVTTRFGNVLGSNGSVIPLFKEQIAKGGPLTVTDPRVIRYFMTIPEACRLVLQAATLGSGNDIFIFDMGHPVKIDDLAKRMISLSGLELGRDIEIKYVGLRPGEKLYEELLKDEENVLDTSHEKIFRAKVRKYDIDDVDVKLAKLFEVASSYKKEDTVRVMKEIVPEFKSENSRYSRLDFTVGINE